MTGGETLSDGPHQQADDRTGWTSHLPLERKEGHSRRNTFSDNSVNNTYRWELMLTQQKQIVYDTQLDFKAPS